jgi:hypothetical protein
MSKALPIAVLGGLTVLGANLIYWPGQLSVLYNSWTTSFREPRAHTNPPTPQMRAFHVLIRPDTLRANDNSKNKA